MAPCSLACPNLIRTRVHSTKHLNIVFSLLFLLSFAPLPAMSVPCLSIPIILELYPSLPYSSEEYARQHPPKFTLSRDETNQNKTRKPIRLSRAGAGVFLPLFQPKVGCIILMFRNLIFRLVANPNTLRVELGCGPSDMA